MEMHNSPKSRFPAVFCSFVFFFATILLPAQHGYGSTSSDPVKSSELETKLENDSKTGTNTLAPALMTSLGGEGVGIRGVSLLATPFTVGTRGAVQYQKFGENSYRIQADDAEGAASFFLLFQYEMDLRDRWIRIAYSGRSAPEKIYVVVDRLDESRSDAQFPVYLERSGNSHDSFFKLPARLPYSKVRSLDFIIDPKDQTKKQREFVLLDLQVMPQHFDPLNKGSVESMRIPDFLGLFQPDNRIPATNMSPEN